LQIEGAGTRLFMQGQRPNQDRMYV